MTMKSIIWWMKLYQKDFYKPISLFGKDNLLRTYDSGRRGIDQPFATVFISVNKASDKYVILSNMLNMLPQQFENR